MDDYDSLRERAARRIVDLTLSNAIDNRNRAHAAVYALMNYDLLKLKQEHPEEYAKAREEISNMSTEPSGFYVVGITGTAERLAFCVSAEQASEYIGTLPNAESGMYYIDGPCLGPVVLSRRSAENIKLEYPVIIRYVDEQYHAPLGAEFFMDEHGIQWVKFYPNNGYQRGKEHIVRTNDIIVIRDRDRERRAAAQE